VASGNYPLWTERESGNYCESFMPLSIFRCNGLGKKKQIKVSVPTALAQESFMVEEV